jgi:phospho-N-acetylmuramoyl-pentapeptide-transferase
MGDTGSLALGGALAALAILTRTELLLVLIGGLFLITTGSVILQRAWFKITKRRYGQGRRIFLMSPLHHHFELKGWAEITVVVRFWIIGALFVAAGVGTFYLEWVSR